MVVVAAAVRVTGMMVMMVDKTKSAGETDVIPG